MCGEKRREEGIGTYHAWIRARGVERGDDLVQHRHIERCGEIQKLRRAGERHGGGFVSAFSIDQGRRILD